jgi:hypothetical protein
MTPSSFFKTRRALRRWSESVPKKARTVFVFIVTCYHRILRVKNLKISPNFNNKILPFISFNFKINQTTYERFHLPVSKQPELERCFRPIEFLQSTMDGGTMDGGTSSTSMFMVYINTLVYQLCIKVGGTREHWHFKRVSQVAESDSEVVVCTGTVTASACHSGDMANDKESIQRI